MRVPRWLRPRAVRPSPDPVRTTPRRPAFRPRLEILEGRSLPATLLADLNTATGDSLLNPFGNTIGRTIAVIGSAAYFPANGGSASGEELWKSDGTAAGTALVKDIAPGALGSSPRELTVVNGTLFFTADDGTGRELWKSDGTPGGTVLVKDIAQTGSSWPRALTAVNGALFFVAQDDTGVPALWTTDGTTAHTVKLLDLSWLQGPDAAPPMVGVNGTLFFEGYDPDNGYELWTSDGTKQGTALVTDIFPGAGSSSPQSLTDVNGALYFTANDGATGRELWTSNGTPAGTGQVKDILPGAGGSEPQELTAVNGALYFTADDGATGREVWRTDGTEFGTAPLDLTPGSAGSNPRRLIDVNGTLFFAATGPSGTGLYRTDGSPGGTSFVTGTNTILGGYSIGQLAAAVGGALYFTANDGTTGWELWKTNGTPAGTALVRDIVPGSGDSLPLDLTDLNGTLLFSASTPDLGRELWRSTGTEAGTTLVKDINDDTLGSSPRHFAASNGSVFIAAGHGLWKTDPASGATALVKDFSGRPQDTPDVLADANGTLYFTVTGLFDPFNNELWKTDGTEAGTVRVAQQFQWVQSLTYLNGKLVIVNQQAVIYEGSPGWPLLWASDGTASGTVPIGWFPQAARFSAAVTVGGALYIGVAGGLWRTDGTATGTSLVKQFDPTGVRTPAELTVLNGTLYFTIPGAAGGRELWTSDGTGPGTLPVKAFASEPFPTAPNSLTAVNGGLFFTADDGAGSRGLWRSDGTAAGTVMVKDIDAGDLTDVGGTLFFARSSELWKSDGTTAGTVLLKAFEPLEGSSPPRFLTAVNGVLFFSANDGTTGVELWKSDGTAAGTVLAQDINPGSVLSFPSGSFPSGLTNINGRLYFTADDGRHGQEPWVEASRQDNDVDGVSDVVEAAGPNGGDGNFDGIPDAQQLNVASLPNSADGTYVTLAAPAGTTLVGVAAPPNPAPDTAPAGVLFPAGFFDFTVAGVPPGGATTVVLRLANGARVDTYWNYGPTPDNRTPHWYQFLYDGTTGAEIDNTAHTITLHFVDGQRGDSDLTADGRVVDPGGPAAHPVMVRIDVKPGDSSNSINLGSQGTISVALFGSATFDAARAQVGSIVFAGAHAYQFSLQDVNRDGRLDLVLQFRTQDTNLQQLYEQLLIDDKDADGVLDSTRQTATVSLTGRTQSGVSFEGFDTLELSLSGKTLRDLLDQLFGP
jgi:ELWxxDGT repeat protein